MLSDFASKFDAVYCIHYLPYTERKEYMERTLSEHGLFGGNFKWFYTADNACFDNIYKTMLDVGMIFQSSEQDATKNRTEGYIKNNRVFNLAINEYNLMNQIYLLGYERVLILEDDIAFLKNKDLLKKYIAEYPFDCDIVSMEYWFREDLDYSWAVSDNRRVNDYYRFLSTERIVNFSCVGLSRRGVKHWLDGMNQHFMNSDYYIANQHTFDDWHIRRCISKIPLCVQRVSRESNHTAELYDMKWKYDKIKLDLNLYDGYC